MLMEQVYEFARNRDFPLFPPLRIEATVWLCRNPNGTEAKIQVSPVGIHDFLLAHHGQQERRKHCCFERVAYAEEPLEVIFAVLPGQSRNLLRQMKFTRKSRPAVP